MKKIIKSIAIFAGAGILFCIICPGTEYLIMKKIFPVEDNLFFYMLIDDLLRNIVIYLCICCILFVLNYIYNYIIIKKLNKNLEIYKERNKKDERK